MIDAKQGRARFAVTLLVGRNFVKSFPCPALEICLRNIKIELEN